MTIFSNLDFSIKHGLDNRMQCNVIAFTTTSTFFFSFYNQARQASPTLTENLNRTWELR